MTSTTDPATTNLYRVGPRRIVELATDALKAGLVPNVTGSPGVGKSSLFRKICNNFNLHMIDHRVSTSAPEDFTGLPEFMTRPDGTRIARFSPFADLFPIVGTPLPVGKDGWMLFLDEFNSGTKMVQAACYKLILDKMTGQYPLHERVAIACAQNLNSDRAITTQMSTAMQSRMVWLELQVVFNEWFEDVALTENYDERIRAFLSYKEENLMDFKPDHDEKTFCCPRTWEFMNRLIKGNEVTAEKTPLYAGTITSGVAASFVAFCALQKELVTINDILADPDNVAVPQEAQRKWIVTTHLLGKVDQKNFGDLCRYINRFDISFRITFFRGIIVQHPTLYGHPEFAKAMIALSKYLTVK